ncbi:baculoviral IAP repeat-containing protein 2-like [Lingula anatina]|uniref:Baculoviral IAP repeat-containing protein 2-like n=1 Tax=Lingula anatina TaxID=7574 RepID=A0A1S3I4R8_LINAN|nr:baculoviral IAP repeat-containing protein 2-like [Lingula anatina]|eukprot:XP_013393218.1 baculoviral IAP repeat-containing protein 2-like [Lingula anatina]
MHQPPRRPGDLPNLDENPVVYERARHPSFATIHARLSTYESWPPEKDQTPASLAEAGFFYAGFNDNVKCFFCNGGLKNWEVGDEPWREHARWFPKCGFLKQCKGLEFIRSVVRSGRGSPPGIPGGEQGGAPSSQSPRTLSAELRKPYARAALDVGFEESVVKQAIQQRWDTLGDDFPNAPALLDAVFELQSSDSKPRDTESPVEGASALTTPEKKEKLKDEGKTKTEDPYEDIRKENQRLKELKLCKICKAADADVLILPCAHIVSCDNCKRHLSFCPVCGGRITALVKTYPA